MVDPELDVASLVSKIEQLEKRQNLTAQYAIGVKHQLDELTEQFNTLQQHFNQLLSLSNSLNKADTTELTTEAATVDDAQVVKRFFERVDQQQSVDAIASTVISHKSESLVDPAQVKVNADTAETNQVEEADTAAQEQNTTAFTEQEFKYTKTQYCKAFSR